MRERTEMLRGRGGRLPVRGRSEVHAPRSSSEIFTLRGPGGVDIPPSCPMAATGSSRGPSAGRNRAAAGRHVDALEAHLDRTARRRAAVVEPAADRRLTQLNETLVDHDRVEALALAPREDGRLDEVDDAALDLAGALRPGAHRGRERRERRSYP